MARKISEPKARGINSMLVPASAGRSHRSELAAIVYFCAGLFTVLAIVSYDPRDPSFNGATSRPQITNLCGLVGSHVADALIQAFGLASLLVAVVLGMLGVRALMTDRSPLRWTDVMAAAVVISATSSLLNRLGVGRLLAVALEHPGGALGILLHTSFLHYLGKAGEILVGVTLMTVSLLHLARVSVSGLCRSVVSGFGRMIGGLRSVAAGIASRRAQPRQACETTGSTPADPVTQFSRSNVAAASELKPASQGATGTQTRPAEDLSIPAYEIQGIDSYELFSAQDVESAVDSQQDQGGPCTTEIDESSWARISCLPQDGEALLEWDEANPLSEEPLEPYILEWPDDPSSPEQSTPLRRGDNPSALDESEAKHVRELLTAIEGYLEAKAVPARLLTIPEEIVIPLDPDDIEPVAQLSALSKSHDSAPTRQVSVIEPPPVDDEPLYAEPVPTERLGATTNDRIGLGLPRTPIRGRSACGPMAGRDGSTHIRTAGDRCEGTATNPCNEAGFDTNTSRLEKNSDHSSAGETAGDLPHGGSEEISGDDPLGLIDEICIDDLEFPDSSVDVFSGDIRPVPEETSGVPGHDGTSDSPGICEQNPQRELLPLEDDRLNACPGKAPIPTAHPVIDAQESVEKQVWDEDTPVPDDDLTRDEMALSSENEEDAADPPAVSPVETRKETPYPAREELQQDDSDNLSPSQITVACGDAEPQSTESILASTAPDEDDLQPAICCTITLDDDEEPESDIDHIAAQNPVMAAPVTPEHEPPDLQPTQVGDSVIRAQRPEATALSQVPVRESLAGEPTRSFVVAKRADDEHASRTRSARAPQPDDYKLPPTDLLESPPESDRTVDEEVLATNAAVLERKLLDLGVKGEVVEIHPGPVITMFEVSLGPGIPLRKILNMADDLAMALKSGSTRIVAPIAGKDTVGIEVPNLNREIVYFREVVESPAFTDSRSSLKMALGKGIDGQPFATSLGRMPHLLIAGATGTGKSVGLNCLICSWLMSHHPDDLKLILVDPKKLELSYYQDIPHLLHPVVTDPEVVPKVLNWAIREMERRYELLSLAGAKSIDGYNKRVLADELQPGLDGEEPEKLPYIVIIVDELAELMMVAAKDIEVAIARLAQMARAAGIHLILATQRPSVDVITGLIKANFPARLSFQVSARADSRTILDTVGAEHLLGRGDLLFLPPGTAKLTRLHGAFVSETDIKNVVDFIKVQRAPVYLEEITRQASPEAAAGSASDLVLDPKYDEAVELVSKLGHASISLIQRHMRIGYNRAARIVEAMEAEGIIGPSDGTSRPREVLVGSLQHLDAAP